MDDEDDILAAFNASAPVDASSHFPPGQSGTTSDYSSRSQSQHGGRDTPASRNTTQFSHSQSLLAEDDDDPFGLSEMGTRQPPSRNPASMQSADDDENILGLLGKPVDERQRASKYEAPLEDDFPDETLPTSGHPADKAVAEIVDMGFPVDKARLALEHTDTGLNVQAAIGWLLQQAHEEARNKSRARDMSQSSREDSLPPRSRQDGGFHNDRTGSGAVWLQQPQRPDRADSRSPASSDRDVAQYAQQFGSTLFKSANTLWKTGQKKAQKALAEYQQHNREVDGGQPKWMRDAELRNEDDSARGRDRTAQEVTDEAAMLEPGRAPPSRHQDSRRRYESDDILPQRPRANNFEEPAWAAPPRPISRPVEKLSRRAVEEESAQAYISPARRKKASPTPPSQPASVEESSLDIFSDMPAPAPVSRPVTNSRTQHPAPAQKASTPVQVRPKATPRSTPTISPTSLSTSTTQRLAGSAAFKRGDYGEATTCYSAALAPLPPQHPITIILHCNRALTHLKTGDAKAAIVDADAALTLIGPSRGEDESISLGADESPKPMKEFHGKALMRKAEAYEHLEKWEDAAKVWREAVEAGVGGAVSIQGRNRCEKAAGGDGAASSRPAAPAARAPPKKPAAPKPVQRKPASAMSDLAGNQSSEAVQRLRAANAAAAQASDEAFALNDSVTARISGWRDGKEGNLRALLASLDTVLWDGANWTKVGMGDLIMPNKVKIVYMKAIARVHPDKVSFLCF